MPVDVINVFVRRPQKAVGVVVFVRIVVQLADDDVFILRLQLVPL